MTADHADKKPANADPKKKPATKAVKKPAGKKPAEKITSKADLIRKVAGIINAKGEKPRPTEIVTILAEEGVAQSRMNPGGCGQPLPHLWR